MLQSKNETMKEHTLSRKYFVHKLITLIGKSEILHDFTALINQSSSLLHSACVKMLNSRHKINLQLKIKLLNSGKKTNCEKVFLSFFFA